MRALLLVAGMLGDENKRLRDLAEKATPGPWIKDFSDFIQVGGEAIGTCERYENAYPNAEFIAASRTAIPQLCDALEGYIKDRAELERQISVLTRKLAKKSEK